MPQTIRMRDGFGADLVRDGRTFVEMGQVSDTGAIETNWHRTCAKDPNGLGRRAVAANDLPLGVEMADRARDAVAQAMAMRTVTSTIVPNEELI